MEDTEKLSISRFKAKIEVSVKTNVLRVPNVSPTMVRSLQLFTEALCAIRRSIVADDDLKRFIILIEDLLDALLERCHPVASGYTDCD